MTSLTIQLPDELLQRAERLGLLKSNEVLSIFEKAIFEREQQYQDTALPEWLNQLGLPDGVAEIELDLPRSQEMPRPVDLL